MVQSNARRTFRAHKSCSAENRTSHSSEFVSSDVQIGKGSPLGQHSEDGRVVFNIGGNKYRIVAWINYPYRVLYIRFVGTHAQYDLIDAQTV